MAKVFYYPIKEFGSGTFNDGTLTSGGNFISVPGTITNEEYLTDQSIGLASTTWIADEALRVDLGSAVACDFLAIYATASDTDNFVLYGSANSNASGKVTVKTITATLSAGWNVYTFNSASYRYWFLRKSSGTNSFVSEILLGNAYTFGLNFDLNNVLGHIPFNDVVTTPAGLQYSNQVATNLDTWKWNWSYITSSMKTSLESINTNVGTHLKFIYYDETNYNWVKMSKLMQFTEVAPSVYSTSVNLREQRV